MNSYIAYPPSNPVLAPIIADVIWVLYPLLQSLIVLGTPVGTEGSTPKLDKLVPKLQWLLCIWCIAGVLHLAEALCTLLNAMAYLKYHYSLKILVGILMHANLFGIPQKLMTYIIEKCNHHYALLRKIPQRIIECLRHPSEHFTALRTKTMAPKEEQKE